MRPEQLQVEQDAMRARLLAKVPVDPAVDPDEIFERLVVSATSEKWTLTKYENQAKQELESEGWTVLRYGWPDFLCFRIDPQTGETTVHPVEVKPPNTRKLRPSQKVVATILAKSGLPVVIYNPGDKSVQYSMLSTSDRIRLGMEKAKREGKQIGRKTIDGAVRRGVIADRKLGLSLNQLARAHGISKASVCRVLQEANRLS